MGQGLVSVDFCCAVGLLAVEGAAKTSLDKYLPWLLGSDVEPLVFVDPGSATPKKLLCLAELAYQSCQSTGITDMTMIDHDLNPKLEA